MRRGAFVLALFSLMLLAGCFGPTTASWGSDNGGVEVDFDRASTSITSNLGPTVQNLDELQAVGCSPGEEEMGTNKSMPVKFTGYLAASQMYATHDASVTGIGAAVTSSVAIQSMSFNQASEMLEGEGARVDLKEWNDPLNPQTGAGTVDLDEIDADEESRWYILGLIPSTESVHDGMLSLGEWHQPVSVEGYLVASNASNAYGYHSSQKVADDCTVLIGNQNREQLFVMVTSINLEGASVSSSGDADDEWVHGDVPILGRTGFVLMFFIVGIGGAVASFTLSKMFVMKGARDTMKTLLGQVGIDNIKKVKQDVKKAKSSGMSSPTTRKEEQRSAAKKDKAAPTKTPKKSALAGFDMDSILSNDDDAAPIPSSSGKSSVVVTPAAEEMEQMTPPSTTTTSSVTSTQPSVWDASKRSSSPPTSVTSSQPEPVAREHFSSVAPTRSSAPEPKQPPKKKAVRKRRAAAKPVEEEATPYEAPPRAEKETFEDDENFSDFSF
jgi:hypothetical protein